MAEMIGMLAGSKAGHDKNHIYVIIKEEAEYVYLADGKLKTTQNPKKKNKKHIQIIKICPDSDFPEKIRMGQADDSEIRRVLKQYKSSMNDQ